MGGSWLAWLGSVWMVTRLGEGWRRCHCVSVAGMGGVIGEGVAELKGVVALG